MLNNKYIYKLDSKNRFSIPGSLLKQNRRFYLTLGLDGCIFMYSEKEWKKIQKKFSLLNYAKAGNRKFLRIFSAHSREIKADSHNRLLLPKHLKQKASIGRELLIIKILQNYEIWAPSKFAEYEKNYDYKIWH